MRNIWQWTVITIGKKVESRAIDKPHSLIGKAFQYEHNSERDQRINQDLKEMGVSDFEPLSTVDLINLKNTDRQRLIYFAFYYYKVTAISV